ncbi:hypothetical protein GQS78_06105 [Thermococcus bergensis]|uniref:hypothetical protein n=1 Tax=Thermococcus bergensis TaxID=2689387 RepID=UPI001CEDEED0|nr:hypothetical protein [Thermococcus bergensis]MCA6213828.1 hypothetical protein [Thermococcus bergensis]
MWKKTLALLFSFLILGLAFSGASATASLVNSTVNGTVMVPQEFSPEKRPGDEIQPENVGAEIVVEKFFGGFVPGIGWVVFIGGVVLAISKYLYSKPVSEFTEAFYKELPDRISYNGQELAKGIESKNFWGTKVEIGYGYVKKKWGGLKKETVIVKSVITITRDEVKAVEDLFSPKEYGKLLAQAYLNGWDANDAKKLAEDFDEGYRGFRAHFNGANLDCGVFEGGDVIIDAKGAKHIIFNHLMKKPGKDQFTHISAVDLLNEMGKVIENPDKIECGDIVNGKQRIVLVP